MKEKLERLQELVEWEMYSNNGIHINPNKKEAIEIIKELKTKIN